MTENEQKQQLSVAFVHAVAARAGYACQVRVPDEDSVDLVISACGLVHQSSLISSPRLDVQLKATSAITVKPKGKEIVFPLPIKNYDELRAESLVPKLLIVFRLPKLSSEWLALTEQCMVFKHCAYWVSLSACPPASAATKVSIRLPRSQQFTVEALQELMKRVSRQESL